MNEYISVFSLVVVGKVPRQNNIDKRQSWEQADHAGVRILRRVSTQVRLYNSLEVLHGDIWLLKSICNNRWQGKHFGCYSLKGNKEFILQKTIIFW